MKIMCEDCMEQTERKFKQEVEIILFPSWQWPVKLLCQDHFDEYAYSEGEFNLDYCYLGDLSDFFRQLNEKLAYMEKKYLMILDEWNEQKKIIQSLSEKAKEND